jgi:hypothetical protein
VRSTLAQVKFFFSGFSRHNFSITLCEPRRAFPASDNFYIVFLGEAAALRLMGPLEDSLPGFLIPEKTPTAKLTVMLSGH